MRALWRKPTRLGLASGACLGFLALQSLAQGMDGGALLRQHHVPDARSLIQPPRLPERRDSTGIPAAGNRVFVKSYHLDADQALISEAQANALLKPYRDRELSLEELQQAAELVAREVQRSGHTFTRAYIPPQEVRDATVTITIVSGRLARSASGAPELELQLAPTLRIDRTFAQDILGSALAGDAPAGMAQIERGMLLLNELAGVKASSIVVPGSEAGTLGLQVRMDPEDAVDGGLSLDNFGSRTTGEWRAGASLGVNSPAGRGDQLRLRVSHSVGADSLNASYAIPLAPNGMKLTTSAYLLRYEQGKELSPLDSRGSARGASAVLGYPFILRRRDSLLGTLQLDLRKLEDSANGVAISGRKIGSLGAGLQASSLLGGDSAIGYGLSLVLGDVDKGGVTADLLHDRLTRRTDGGFSVLRLNSSYVGQLTPRLSLHAHAFGQIAGSNLDSSERLYPGGPRGVRAYGVEEAGGDEGGVLSVEARWRPALLSALPRLSLFGFVDGARLRRDHERWPGWAAGSNGQPNNYSLKGSGAGVSWVDPRRGSIELVYARRLGNAPAPASAAVDETRDRDRFWMSASLFFR